MLLHFIWINRSLPFGEGEYVCLLSALKNTSYDIRLHTNLKPDTIKEWNPYELLIKWKDRFDIIYTPEYAEETFRGGKLRINWITDIDRVRILHQYGGMYSDLDIVWFNDVPKDQIENIDFALSWENKSYLVAQDAWMFMTKGNEAGLRILEEVDATIARIKDKPEKLTSKKIRDYLTFFYILGDYAKKNNLPILSRNLFFKNSWRRTGRALRRLNLPTKNNEQVFGNTNDKISFSGSCGFHYGSSLFPWSSIKMLPELSEVLKKLNEDCEGHQAQCLRGEHTQEHARASEPLHQEAVEEEQGEA